MEVQVCESLDEIQERATHLNASGELRCVVAAGGDGTAAAVANRIAADVPVLIFPLGTENLLAKHHGIVADVPQARNRVRQMQCTNMDVGLANGRLFLVMASCGFDAAVVNQMHSIRTGHINRFSYTRPILHALRHYHFPNLFADFPESTIDRMGSAWLFIFNVPRYAAELSFCPQADPSDGQLDICGFRKPGIWHGLRYLFHLWRSKHQGLVDFDHRRARSIIVTCDGPVAVPYQLDGDPGGTLPLNISTLPDRLRLVVG